MISGEIEVNQLDKIHFIFEQKQNLRTTLKKLEKNSLKQAEKQNCSFKTTINSVFYSEHLYFYKVFIREKMTWSMMQIED